MAAVIDIGTMIASNPKIHGGRPIIAGTGVTVQRIAVLYKNGFSPEEIVRKIDHLSLAQIYSALAYFHANRAAIESEIVAEDQAYEALMQQHYQSQTPQP
jgi:uncharacterized protein (DUF433 family)